VHPNDLTGVAVSGVCATPDGGVSAQTGRDKGLVAVDSPGAGVCHVELTFADGFTYSNDVTFASRTVCGCPSFIGPTAGPFMVDNPNDTCGEGGADAGPE
jgi:hypothetical protein